METFEHNPVMEVFRYDQKTGTYIQDGSYSENECISMDKLHKLLGDLAKVTVLRRCRNLGISQEVPMRPGSNVRYINVPVTEVQRLLDDLASETPIEPLKERTRKTVLQNRIPRGWATGVVDETGTRTVDVEEHGRKTGTRLVFPARRTRRE